MRAVLALLRVQLLLLRRDPATLVIVVAMPVVLCTLLTPSSRAVLFVDGYAGAPGSAQAVPGMATVFSFFGVALVTFALFREHAWRTWTRLRVAGLGGRHVLPAVLALPALLLVVQHTLLFAIGIAFLDLEATGSWPAVGLVAGAYIAAVLALGLLAAATFASMPQVNAVVNLGAMVLGGLGGGFVPVSQLPGWVEPIAPISPAYWAMEGYREALLEGGGVADVLPSLAVLGGLAILTGLLAARRLDLDRPKRVWG